MTLIAKAHKDKIVVLGDYSRLPKPLYEEVELAGRRVALFERTPVNADIIRRAGGELPAGAGLNYSWPCPPHWTVMEHQKATAELAARSSHCFILNGTGTGKTASVLWAAHALMLQGEIKRVLILAPLSTLKHVWYDEITTLFPGRSVGIMHGPAAKRREALAAQPQFLITNHHGVKTERDALVAEDFDVVIIDEATVFKNPNSALSKAAFKVTDGRRVWQLTATPTAKGPLDAYGLAKLNRSENLPRSLTAWKYATMTQHHAHKFIWWPKPDSKEKVREILKPAIKVMKDDVLDLPVMLGPVSHTAELSDEQKKFIDTLRKEQLIERENEADVTAVNAAVLLSKVVQAAQGVVKDDDDNPVMLDNSPRLKVVNNIIDSHEGEKVIVFVPFVAVANRLATQFQEGGRRVALVTGATSQKQRGEIFGDFQKEDKYDVLVCIPDVTAHGLTLTAASVIIWFGPVMGKTELYQQGLGRVNRKGQTKKMTYYHISAHYLERKMFAILESNSDYMKDVLNLYESFVANY